MVVNAYNPIIWEDETGRLLVPDHPELQRETLSQNRSGGSRKL
jgi:hypothetical protein